MLYGKRIRLRAIERADLPLFVRWCNDPEVREGISIYRPLSLAAEEGWFDKMMQTPPDQHPMMIEVQTESGEWTSIGNIGFHEINWRDRTSEFGIVIGEKAYWNRGYGSEAVRLLVDYGFQTLNLNRIYLKVYETNPRAVRAYEKAGFVLEGRLRQAHFAQGKYCDDLIMSILREEYGNA